MIEDNPRPLKERTEQSLFWSMLNNGTLQLLNILFGVVLARLLTPGDYGIVGFVAWDGGKVRGGDGERGRILELVLSCRVARKGVERRVLEMLPQGLAIEVVETARNAPIRQIVADWQAGHLLSL